MGDILLIWVRREGDKWHKTLGYLERKKKGPSWFPIRSLSLGWSHGSPSQGCISGQAWEHCVPCFWVAGLPGPFVPRSTLACDLIRCCQFEFCGTESALFLKNKKIASLLFDYKSSNTDSLEKLETMQKTKCLLLHYMQSSRLFSMVYSNVHLYF